MEATWPMQDGAKDNFIVLTLQLLLFDIVTTLRQKR